VWASHHEELWSDDGAAPHVCDLLVGPDLRMALERCNPPGAAVDAGLEAAAHARQAERTADGGVLSVPASPSGGAICTADACATTGSI